MSGTNTAKNSATGRPFTKGDPRINRKGRPKSFDALRELARQISHEEAQSGGQPIVINGHTVTVAEALLRQLAQSKNPKDRQLFIEIAYGKVPNPVELTGKDGGPLAVEHTHHLAEVSDDDLRRNLAAFGRAALAASGRAPVPEYQGGATGDDSESESQ